MKINISRTFAGVLSAAVCLGWTGQARAFWTNGGQGGGALEQLGVSSEAQDFGDIGVGSGYVPTPGQDSGDVGAGSGYTSKPWQDFGDIGAGSGFTSYEQPGARAHVPAAQGDIFTEIKACKAVDRTYVMRPTIGDALKTLAPCMKGVTKIYGNNVYAESSIMNPDSIRIVVLDSVAGKTIVEDLKAAIDKRGGGLFGHKVDLAVMDVSYKPVKVTDCSGVSGVVETNARISVGSDLAALVDNSQEYRLVVPDIEKGKKCERMGDNILRMTVYTQLTSPAFEFSAPATPKNGRRTQWVAPVYPPNRKIIEKVVYLYDVKEDAIIDRRIFLADKDQD